MLAIAKITHVHLWCTSTWSYKMILCIWFYIDIDVCSKSSFVWDIEVTIEKLKEARKKNQKRFYKIHWLWPKTIEESDWVLVYNNSLDNQNSILQKISKHWFGPYIIIEVYDNDTYFL